MDKVVVILSDSTRLRAAQAFVDAPDGWVMELKPATRSIQQNAMLHAFFSRVSKVGTFHGRKLSPIQWKNLFISGHAIATGIGADVVPGLENEFVNIRESSAQMSISRMSSLIEYIGAWCASNDVQLPAGPGYEKICP